MSSPTPATLLGGAADLPRHEVERLLMAAAGLDRAGLLLTGALPDEAVHRFEALVARRRAGEPLQYLEATVDFGPVTLHIDHRALIPRPETERLWELATELLGAGDVTVDVPVDVKVIVDLCTGSGNLALACARHWPGARVLATDRSTAAAALARENADALALPVEVLVGDLFDPLPPALAGRVDLLVANPPYLSEAELEQVPAEVLAEPRDALVAGPDGIEVVARIGAEAGRWLGPGGIALVEVSEHHADRAAARFAGLDAIVCHDLTGRPRFVVARRPGEER